jgi:hypothetical protein
MDFEWDDAKEASNISKHKIDFEIAKLVFDDPLHVTDTAKTVQGEKRFNTIGSIEGIITVAVLHTYRNEAIRIISARPASRTERKRYEQFVSEKAGTLEGTRGAPG